MDYKDILILAVSVAVCLIAKSAGCEEVEIITCRRENMTCLKALCHCSNKAPSPIYSYFSSVSCSDLSEVPKDIPKEVYILSITGNTITTIKRGDFNNMLNLDRLYLNDNKIRIIEPGGFVNLSRSGILMNLANNNLSRITANMFRDILVYRLQLDGNPIKVIEKHAFVNLPILSLIEGITPFLKTIETEAFVNLTTTLSLVLSTNNATVIQKNAFMNVNFQVLVMNANFRIKDNRFITATDGIHFTGGYVQCDCDLMWLVYLRQVKPIQTSGSCANNNKAVPELVPEDFHCIDNASPLHMCNASQSVDLPCEYNYLSTNLTRWIHSVNGKFIRELSKDFVIDDTKTLHFPFCNHDDSGEYTCMLTTDYSFLPSINMSLHLLINDISPPVYICNTSQSVDLPCEYNYLSTNLTRWIHSRNGKFIRELNKDFVTEDTNSLHLSFCNHDDSGEYTCMLTTDYSFLPSINRSFVLLVKDISPPVYICNTSQSVDLPCEYNYLSTNLTRWIHSRNGRFIRELSKDFVMEDTNTIHFPFCNRDDSGEYTCMLTTDYSFLPSINRSFVLLVKGLPVVLNQHTEDDGADLILSVMFYSIPYEFYLQWFLGDNNLNGDPQYTITVNNMTVVLKQYHVYVTTAGFLSNLTIHNFVRLQSAVYSCKMSNSYGSVVEQIVSIPANIELQRRTYVNTSHSIELTCTLKLVGATPLSWVHSHAGETIRPLLGRHENNSNILTIPFCNSQDSGDYTCRWKTDIPGQTLMEKSTTLSVSGPPFIISNSILVDGSDTVLSVTFFSKPYPSDPKWYYNNEPVALGTKFLQTTTYSMVQIRQHRVLVNEEGFISNLTVQNADYALYKCVIQNSFGQVDQSFIIKQEQNKLSISTTEAVTSPESEGNNMTVIIAICSTVFGVAVVVICIIFFIRRFSPNMSDRYNSTMPTRNEDSTYDTISMSTPPKRPDDQADYMEVF